jgi:hypothetical protein
MCVGRELSKVLPRNCIMKSIRPSVQCSARKAVNPGVEAACCVHVMCLSLVPRGTLSALWYSHQERDREIGERIQNPTMTPEDKALFEAASRIIKLEVKEKSSPWIRLLDALHTRSLPIKDARRISQVAALNTKGNNQLRVRGVFSSGATSN